MQCAAASVDDVQRFHCATMALFVSMATTARETMNEAFIQVSSLSESFTFLSSINQLYPLGFLFFHSFFKLN